MDGEAVGSEICACMTVVMGPRMAATAIRTGYRSGLGVEESVNLTFTRTDDVELHKGQAWKLEVAASFGETQ